jgi:hypothetical protein
LYEGPHTPWLLQSRRSRVNGYATLFRIKGRLNFLKPLDSAQLQGLVKVGNGYSPFLEKAYRGVNAHPDIMPRLFDLAEFNNDYLLAKDLSEISDQLKSLSE